LIQPKFRVQHLHHGVTVAVQVDRGDQRDHLLLQFLLHGNRREVAEYRIQRNHGKGEKQKQWHCDRDQQAATDRRRGLRHHRTTIMVAIIA